MEYILYFYIFISILSGCRPAISPDKVVFNAMRYMNTPYVWGGESSKGIDCSGLVWVSFTISGKSWDRTTALYQSKFGDSIGNIKNIRKGDVLFFKQGKEIDHVGIMVSDKPNDSLDFEFIHAAKCNGKVKINKFSDYCAKGKFKWKDIYSYARRVKKLK